MFWDDTPFEARIQFMYNNVMEISEDFHNKCDSGLLTGFQQFRELLLEIFSAPNAFEGTDALERFHSLSYSTQVFFPAVIQAGEVIESGSALRVAKSAFKKAFKKQSAAPFQILPNFGAVFQYYKKEKPVASYAACDTFILRFEQRENMIGVLPGLLARFAEVDMKREYSEALVMLCKADYDRLLLGRPALREEINLMRPDIVRSAGDHALLYQAIVRHAEALNLTTSASIQRYANPTWNINFLYGKKLRLKTIWCEGRNLVHVPIPFESGEVVITNRDKMPARVREAIERFGCVNCGRCKNGGKVRFQRVDGITICTGHGESSTLFLSFEAPEEVDAVFEIIASLN